MKLEAVSHIDRTGNVLFRVSLTNEDNSVLTKTLSPQSLISLLQNNCEEKLNYVHIGKLPEGYVNGAIAADDSFWVLIKVPAQKRLLVHVSGHYQIPYPDLIFFFKVDHGRLSEKKVYAIKNQQLYRYPFGNVSSGGIICMGNISFKDLRLNSMNRVVDDFFSGITNNDSYSPGSNVAVSYSQQTLLEKLSTMEKFPDRWLVKSNVSLEKLMKGDMV